MKSIILILIITLVSIVGFAQQSHVNDSLKSVYIIDTFKVQNGVLIAKDGTGFVPFRNITTDQLQYVFELIAYFEHGNKLKKLLDKK